MTPPINIDGTQITGASIDGQDVSEITVDGQTVFSAIPDSESFEHNNLTGNYIGDLSAFNITTDRAIEGSHSLDGDAGGNNSAVIRDAEAFDRNNIQVDYEQYNLQAPRNDGDGGIAFATESSTQYSDMDGYYFNARTSTGGDQLRIFRVDNGSLTQIASNSQQIDSDLWQHGTIKFQSDGTIEWDYYTLPTLSASDTNYSSLNLSAIAFRNFYLDDITFSTVQ